MRTLPSNVSSLQESLKKAPYELGGLAIPNLYLYYFALQLSYASWWLRVNFNNPLVVLEAALVGSYEVLRNRIYREGKYPMKHYTYLMAAIVAIWKFFVVVYGDREDGSKWSPYIPLFRNLRLLEFTSIPDLPHSAL